MQRWRTLRLVRSELVPAVARCAALGADRAGEHIEEEEAASDLPATLVAGTGSTPVVAGELGGVLSDDRCDLADLVGGHAGDVSALRGVLAVVILQCCFDRVEGPWHVGVQLSKEGLPVDPATDEVAFPVPLSSSKCAIDRQRNASVPGQVGSQWSAFDPVLLRRGSTQITVAPLLGPR